MEPDESGIAVAPAKSHGKLALALGVIAISLSLLLGFLYLRSVRRLELEVAQLSQQTEAFRQLVERAQNESQMLAQQASQVATNAQTAAQQRDLAKQAQENSDARPLEQGRYHRLRTSQVGRTLCYRFWFRIVDALPRVPYRLG